MNRILLLALGIGLGVIAVVLLVAGELRAAPPVGRRVGVASAPQGDSRRQIAGGAASA